MKNTPFSGNIFNPAEQLYQQSMEFMKNVLQAQDPFRKVENPAPPLKEVFNISQIFQKWWQEVLVEPAQLGEAYLQWLQDFMQLGNSVQAMLTGQQVPPLVKPADN